MKNVYLKSFLLLTLCWIGTSTALSQIIGASAYILGDNLEVGINDAGHEGAPRLVASNNRSNQALGSPVYFGFVANPQLDGWVNYDGDFFTPGSPENGFGIEVGGVNYSNNASGSLEQIPGSISSYSTEGDCIFVEWDGAVANVDVHIVYRLITTELYYTTEVTLTNTSGADMTDVYYYRNLDPDNNVTIGGGYSTQNTIVAQPTPECEKALVTATQTGPWDSYIGLGAIGENFRVTYGGFTNRDASNIWNGVGFTDDVAATTFADQAISLAYKTETLAPDTPETFLFTVVLDASQVDAAIASLYYFDYLGGGGVIDECAPIVDTAYTCAGNPVEISIDGPSAEDYVWTWDPPVDLDTAGGPTVNASPFVTTEYTVTGTPAPICLAATIEKTIVVEVTPSPIIDITDPGPQCGDFDLTTLITTNLEGSAVEIEFYDVVPDSIDQVDGIWPTDFMTIGDTVYLLMYNPITECYDVEQVIIDFSGGAEAGLDNTGTLCNDGGVLDLNTLLSGAEPDGVWEETSPDPSGGFTPGTGVLDATGVDAGVYTFEYIALGLPPCENDTAVMTITINQLALAGLDGTSSICNTDGTTIDLDDLLDGNNGIGIWVETTASGQFTPGTGIFDGSGLPAGDYTFTYTVDATAPCTPDVADFTVTILPNPPVDAGPDFAVCAGDEATLTGTGAGPGGDYEWTGGVTDDVAFTPAATMTYTLTGTDDNGCENTDDVTITVNALPDVDAGPDFAVCDGDPATLTGTGAGVGGIYDWTGGIMDDVEFTPLATDTYTLTGTDANGCENTDEIIVTVNALPAVVAGDDVAICIGDMATLTGDGAGPGADYVWTGGVTDGVAFSPIVTDVYTVTGTDANGCENTDDVTVTVNPLPAVDAGEDVVVCEGEWVTLTGAGAGPDADYEWTGGGVDGVAFIPGGTEMFTVTGTDANGCVNTDDMMLTVNPLPVIDAGADVAVCDGDPVTLTGTGAGVDGVYVWSGGISDGLSFVPVATTTYTVTGTDENGCENTDDVVVTVNALPAVDAGPDAAICMGDDISLTGTGAGVGGDYTWSGGIIDGVTFSPAATTTYTVTGTDANGCVNTDDVTVTVNPLPVVSFTADVLVGCAPLQVNFSSLVDGVEFYWDFGDGGDANISDPSHVFSGAGLYDVTLTVTSDLGCTASVTYLDYIDVVETPIAEFSYSPYEIDVTNTRVEFFNSSMYADGYEWNFGDASGIDNTENPTHIYPPVGNVEYVVTLTATSDNGCEDVAQQVIVVKDVLLYFIPNTFTPDGDLFNESFSPVFQSGLDIYDYHLMIFNRWGELMFESHNADIGWDGTYGNGDVVEDGTYIWRMEFGETMSDKKHYVDGHVTVLK